MKAIFIGLTTLDIEYLVDQRPESDEKITAHDQLVATGGPATNAAKTFCSHPDSSSLLITDLASDYLAEVCRSQLTTDWGIDLVPTVATRRLATTTISSVTVTRGTGDRSVVSVNAQQSTLVDYSRRSFAWSEVDCVLADGHHMRLAVDVCREARNHDVPIVLDCGSWKEGTGHLLELANWVICSERFDVPGVGGEADAILEYLISSGADGACVTRGSRSMIWSTGSDRGTINVEMPDDVVDTLGAGDVFHGEFVWAASAGRGFTDSLAIARDAATESCRYFGVDRWLRSRQGSLEST